MWYSRHLEPKEQTFTSSTYLETQDFRPNFVGVGRDLTHIVGEPFCGPRGRDRVHDPETRLRLDLPNSECPHYRDCLFPKCPVPCPCLTSDVTLETVPRRPSPVSDSE